MVMVMALVMMVMNMANTKHIPILEAKAISKKYNYPEVVIFAYDPETKNQHVTTFGQSQAQCEDAARAGNHLKRALGWPERLCHAKPVKQKSK